MSNAQKTAADNKPATKKGNDIPTGFVFGGLKTPVEYAPGKETSTADVFGVSTVTGRTLKLYGAKDVLMEFATKEGRFVPSTKTETRNGKEVVREGLPNATMTESKGVSLETIRGFTGDRFPIFASVPAEDGGKDKEVKVGNAHFASTGSLVFQFNSRAASILPLCRTYSGNSKGEERIYLSARNPSRLKQLKDATEEVAEPKAAEAPKARGRKAKK